ncbi:MAG: ABC transporter ATP-binding protein [Chloroflexota bacterium]
MNEGRPAGSYLVEACQLTKHYAVRGRFGGRAFVRAVDGVSFHILAGRTLGLVGESGCGKSTTGRLLLNLEPPTSGTVRFDGRDITHLGGRPMRELRRDMQLVFQDPYSSLNPRMRVRQILAEPFKIHGIRGPARLRSEVAELLDLVGLAADSAGKFPHEFSGGQRQRIVIARAIALRPRFLVCDEPLSALDASVQSQIINLFRDLQRDLHLTYLFISHDLSVVRYLCDDVAVMYLGGLVEVGPKQDVFAEPLHPYTQTLISAIPIANPAIQRRRKRIPLRGDVPSPVNKPTGCHFHPRCPYAVERCAIEIPQWREIRPHHWAACHLAPLPATAELGTGQRRTAS